MIIKRDKVRYVNLDRTYCVSNNCPKRHDCTRNYIKLVGEGVVFPRQVSLADFYHSTATYDCEFYEEDINE